MCLPLVVPAAQSGSSMSGQVWVSAGWAVEQALSQHGAHRSQHHVQTPLAPALLFGSLMGVTGPQLWCLGPG